MKKILINCIAANSAGTLTVAMSLIRSLIKIDDANEYIVLCPAGAGYEKIQKNNIRIVTFARSRLYYFWRIWFDQIYLPIYCLMNKIELIVNLNNLPTVYCFSIPQIVLIQQANIVDPLVQHKTARDRLLFKISEIIFALGKRSVDGFVVQTPIMANQLIRKYKISERMIRIINSGYSTEDDCQAGCPKIDGLFDRGFINVLCLSRYYPNKNLEILVEVAKLIKASGQPIKIFITIDDKLYGKQVHEMMEQIRSGGLDDIIINLGYINKLEVAAAYKNATMYLLPTLLESFGQVYIEAMKYGVPISTSDRDFAHYVCGDAAHYFDPRSPKDIYDAIIKTANDRSYRVELIKKGESRLKQYFKSWDDIAKEYVGIFNEY